MSPTASGGTSRSSEKMPGVELRKTGNRTDIIIHPGKNAFLSSIGCINPCTSLPDADENIDYAGSRRRVIALIEDMKKFLGSVPTDGDVAILNAFAIIDGEHAPSGSGRRGGVEIRMHECEVFDVPHLARIRPDANRQIGNLLPERVAPFLRTADLVQIDDQ